ncbi:Copper chaperone PCu(A)C [Tepidimonas fonticaldi]|uniref:Copper chaperone PCu(A)C n=1 Tax=Tepidimonas fonticaldi TaxID=1101373 RepID=A0A554XHY0_9BURK|nr:copper chaperone PCu(A)C [Tepidimonas fonticaldi]TSE35432.1 Copper chaperone PCu(A)C [Tepidimonas fonticaldi]
MPRNLIRSAAAGALLALTAAAWAQTVKIDEPWVRGTVAQQKATGAFMRLTAPEPMRLVAGESPVAGVVEIHEMAMDGDVMRMRAIPGLALPAGRPVELKPGGYHVMLMDLKRPLAGGETVPLTLVFENAAGQRVRQELQAKVMALGAQPGAMGAGPQGGHRH